jgi:hypothetical protein
MSDLLGRLIDRAAGAPSRVEPVLPSRYESVGALDTAGPLEQTVTRGRVDASDARTNQQKALEPRRASAQPTHVERIIEGSAPASELPPVMNTTAVPLAAVASDSVPEQRVQSSPLVVGANATEPLRVSSEPPSRVKEREVPEPGSTIVPSIPVVKVVREASRPQPSQHAPAPPGIAHVEAAAPVEVQVTIGHIEVRTAPAAAPIPQRRIPRPTVSLEDYLRRRNGGAR